MSYFTQSFLRRYRARHRMLRLRKIYAKLQKFNGKKQRFVAQTKKEMKKVELIKPLGLQQKTGLRQDKEEECK